MEILTKTRRNYKIKAKKILVDEPHCREYDLDNFLGTVSEKESLARRFQSNEISFFMLRRGLHLEEKREDSKKSSNILENRQEKEGAIRKI